MVGDASDTEKYLIAVEGEIENMVGLPDWFKNLPLKNISVERETADRKLLLKKFYDYWQHLSQAKSERYIFSPPVKEMVGLASFDSSKDDRGNPIDRLLRFYQTWLWKGYVNTCKRLGKTPDDDCSEYYRTGKAEIERILSPGSYFVHGTFTRRLASVVEDGGMMSPVARRNHYNELGIQKETYSKDLELTDHPHASALWFHLWGSDAKNPGIYWADDDPNQLLTDMTIFLPAEVVVQHAVAIEMRSIVLGKGTDQEIGVSNTRNALNKGELIFNPDDDTFIPYEQLFYVIPDYFFQNAKNIFLDKGCSEEWLKEHIMVFPVKSWPHERRGDRVNDLGEILHKEKAKIDRWLDQRQKQRGRTIVKVYCSQTSSNELYNADFIPL